MLLLLVLLCVRSWPQGGVSTSRYWRLAQGWIATVARTAVRRARRVLGLGLVVVVVVVAHRMICLRRSAATMRASATVPARVISCCRLPQQRLGHRGRQLSSMYPFGPELDPQRAPGAAHPVPVRVRAVRMPMPMPHTRPPLVVVPVLSFARAFPVVSHILGVLGVRIEPVVCVRVAIVAVVCFSRACCPPMRT